MNFCRRTTRSRRGRLRAAPCGLPEWRPDSLPERCTGHLVRSVLERGRLVGHLDSVGPGGALLAVADGRLAAFYGLLTSSLRLLRRLRGVIANFGSNHLSNESFESYKLSRTEWGLLIGASGVAVSFFSHCCSTQFSAQVFPSERDPNRKMCQTSAITGKFVLSS